ncbi:hypothetical protein A4G99_18930 [Haladaptatus sp. R4]|uniref:hypothetical protein n=1 Tax=Haladaptatus sp. R4 TaxID=1679489 RepID=UPI0007B4DD33|nr:hypothetical protein [Haladaptatus sp. R4]KZN22547.1 hypothetical protein A4G99_18930 [Haladaptatus sp. R4]
MELQLRNRVREVAEDVTEQTEAVSHVGRNVGETAARETVRNGTIAYNELSSAATSAREAVDIVREHMNNQSLKTPSDPLAIAATANRSTTTLAIEIREFVDAIDHRYAAKSAFQGARRGYIAGPYGAVLGGGIGTMYGAYNSTRETFDPEEPPQPFSGVSDIERYLDGVRHARTGYEVGKRFGTKGKVTGAVIGTGVSTLPLLVERVTASLNGDENERGDERMDAVTE